MPNTSSSSDTRRVRRTLDDDYVAILVHAFVTSRIDYCISLLAGAPKTSTDKLQRVMNTAARIVSNTRKFDRGLTHFRATPRVCRQQTSPVVGARHRRLGLLILSRQIRPGEGRELVVKVIVATKLNSFVCQGFPVF